MPRSKPKAQRLAPPDSKSEHEPDPHAHSGIDPTNNVNSHQFGAEPQERGNHSESLNVNEPHLKASRTSPTPKRRERPADTSATKLPPADNHEQSRVSPNNSNKPLVGKPSPTSIPGTIVDIDLLSANHSRPSTDAAGCPQQGSGTLSLSIGHPSSPPSCATSDTASVALEDCVPELEAFDDIVLPAMQDRRNPDSRKPKKKTSPPRAAKRRSSFKQSSTSRARASESTAKAVVADPTADPTSSTVLAPAPDVRVPLKAGKVDKRKKSSFIFVSDDEAKSVFVRKRASTDGSGSGVAQGDADKTKFGDYWKELETVSLRRSGHSKTGARNSGQKRMRPDSNDVPSLDPQVGGSSSKMTTGAGKSRDGKQGKSGGNGRESEMGRDRYPITEENIDGGDAIPVDVNWKRKAMKRARSAYESFRRSSGKQRSQGHSSHAGNREGGDSMNGTGAGARIANGLDDGEDTGGSTGFSESDGQACMQCGGHGKASKMVLCDVCSDGCHTFCMRPARASVPLGVWICPRCHSTAKKHKVHLSNLAAFLEKNGLVRR